MINKEVNRKEFQGKKAFQNKKKKEAIEILNHLHPKECEIVNMDENKFMQCECKSKYAHHNNCIQNYEQCKDFLTHQYIWHKTHSFYQLPQYQSYIRTSNREIKLLIDKFETKRMQQQILKCKYYTNNHFFEDRNTI